MKEFIVDTNALLSFVTDRNHEQQGKISELFEAAIRSKSVILCPQNVISEFVYVLEKIYQHSKASINRMITDFISMPGIEIRDEIDYKALLDDWPGSISDFGDAVVTNLWRSNPKAAIVTFDKKFIKELEGIGAKVHTS